MHLSDNDSIENDPSDESLNFDSRVTVTAVVPFAVTDQQLPSHTPSIVALVQVLFFIFLT